MRDQDDGRPNRSEQKSVRLEGQSGSTYEAGAATPTSQAPSSHAPVGGPSARGLSDDRRLSLFQAVFDETPDVILLKDENGNFLLCNQTLARLYGTTPDAMVGKHDDDFGVPKEIADGFRANVMAIMASGLPEVVYETSRDAKSGELRHFKSIKRPFRDASGRNQILVIAHDITDVVTAQDRVAASEFTLRQVMKATQEGIWDWHVPTGRLEHNERWFQILGYEAGEVDNNVQAFSSHLHPEDKDMVWAAITRLLNGTDAHYSSEHRMIRKDGTVMWVLDRGRVIERDAAGNPIRVVGAYSDISERKRSEAQLEQALRTAEQATRAKSEFLATMSHELRTPMNGILGMAQLLVSKDVSSKERVDLAQVIVRSGESLLFLLNEILDLSRIEAGKVELNSESFDPHRLVEDVVQVFLEQAKAKGLELRIERSSSAKGIFTGDPNRLRQMLSNYVANAVKFTRAGSISIETSLLTDRSGLATLKFAVRDTGVGFAPEERNLLFKPFSQIDVSSTREHGGSGLGLSIVACLAEQMGGAYGAAGVKGVGAEFWFSVPARYAESLSTFDGRDRPADEGSELNLSGVALVVEDNEVNREVMKAMLDHLGVEAQYACNGQEALELIQTGVAFGVVLMDVQMPVMDGLDAARRIRQLEFDRAALRTPIVAVTAGVFEEQISQCLMSGMDGVLAKPVNLVQLASTLRKWLH